MTIGSPSGSGAPLKYIGGYSLGKVEGPFASIPLTNINSGDCSLVDNDSLFFSKDINSDTVIRFELSSDSLSSANETARTNPFGSTTTPRGITFNNDGSKTYTCGKDAETIESYTLSTNYDLSTASSDTTTSTTSETTDPYIVEFNDDGTQMFLCSRTNTTIHTYNLSTAFDITSKSFVRTTDFTSQVGGVEGYDFSTDGNKLVITDDAMYEYSLSAPYDTSTASFVNSFDVSGADATPRGFEWSQSGVRSVLNGSATENALEFVHGRVVGK